MSDARPPRVLFVDDNAEILAALRLRLRRRVPWEMVFVLSAEEALVQLAASPFDVVVSDMQMPGIDGAELLRRVSATYPRMGRLALTGYVDESVDLEILAHAVLYKPCDGAQLRAAVERVLDSARDAT
jgi:CheY-like chemotaxis protein